MTMLDTPAQISRPEATQPPPLLFDISTALMAKLSEIDLRVLEKVQSDRAEYVDHPSFQQRGIEVKLFGEAAHFLDESSMRFAPVTAIYQNGGIEGGSVPTLSTAQEQLLFKRLNYARSRMVKLQDLYAGRRMNSSTARLLLGWAYRALDMRAEIVRVNIPLVLAMAKRTRLTSVDYNEMISEGNMALLRCVDKFDCGRGFKFSTYACRAILKSFSRVAMKLGRYRGRFPTEFDPSFEQSDHLERKREEREDACIREIHEILAGNFAELSEIELTVIRERFALFSDPRISEASPKTLEEIGTIIGVTKERVRQIQNKALSKIKVCLEEGILAA
jgi:RNA polymerase sigma factor (sigma-70 family)